MAPRSFTHRPAVRRPDPALLGISGPSSSGKTKTALRLAQGLVTVSGGKIFGIDTEQGRMAKYAPPAGAEAKPPHTFAFEHVLLEAPFNPLSYVAAIEYCEQNGAGCIIVDSTSHEHEGEGGRIDSAEKEAERRAKMWNCSIDKVKFGAFAPNSAERNQFRFKLGRRRCHIILCFRAKETTAQVGKDIIDEGFTPIGADAFVWELDSSILLLPHAAGVPTWKSGKRGELLCLKCDDTHRGILDDGKQLTEQHGERIARASSWRHSSQSAASQSRPLTDGAGVEPPQSPPAPSSSDDSFPGDFIRYAGAQFDPAQPAPLKAPISVATMEPFEAKAWAATLAELMKRAPGPARRAWYDQNSEQILQLRARGPGLAARLEELANSDSAATVSAADGDAPDAGAPDDGAVGRVATGSKE